jgi:hypothetical protein
MAAYREYIASGPAEEVRYLANAIDHHAGGVEGAVVVGRGSLPPHAGSLQYECLWIPGLA